MSIPSKIKSLQNPIVKRLVKLRESKAFREEEQSVLVMGHVVIEELLKFLKPKGLYVAEGAHIATNSPYTVVTKEVLKKITALPAFESAVAEFELPKPKGVKNKNFVIVCDAIKDPGNLGTIVRTALALGWEGIFLLPGCCDLFNDKVIRASSGAVFFLPFFHGTEEELKTIDAPLFIADVSGEPLEKFAKVKKAALLLGNESKGPNKLVQKLGKKITIPLENNVESLNVAVAGSILMYALKHS